ncbi:hypothetical protein ABTX60_23000, partial [Streptomyces sp. NPDC126510]|uniref:hypothetical protein n=1 Tax=Streptomyces sp. NPDC126510 TaxID=3155317 RepID=UPI003325F509
MSVRVGAGAGLRAAAAASWPVAQFPAPLWGALRAPTETAAVLLLGKGAEAVQRVKRWLEGTMRV